MRMGLILEKDFNLNLEGFVGGLSISLLAMFHKP